MFLFAVLHAFLTRCIYFSEQHNICSFIPFCTKYITCRSCYNSRFSIRASKSSDLQKYVLISWRYLVLVDKYLLKVHISILSTFILQMWCPTLLLFIILSLYYIYVNSLGWYTLISSQFCVLLFLDRCLV